MNFSLRLQTASQRFAAGGAHPVCRKGAQRDLGGRPVPELAHRLFSFARRSNQEPTPLDLAGVVKEVIGFVGKEADYRSITVRVEAKQDVPRIVSDRGRLQEIFLNLTSNAFAAVSDGGKLGIAIENRAPDGVAIRFSDDGHGIPKADLERIYEPYFFPPRSARAERVWRCRSRTGWSRNRVEV